MWCARATAWGLALALGMLGGGVALGQEPRAEPLLFRFANLTTAQESARIGFAFDLEGPPLVDELPAGALTTLLPGRADLTELWVLPRGQVLPKSLPEPLPLLLPGSGQPISSGLVTWFLIDRPGPRGDLVRKLVAGPQAPAEAAQLRALNLVGTPALDVCLPSGGPVAHAVPAWGLSRFNAWAPPAASRSAATWLTLQAATEPACRGPKLGAVALRLAARGAWTLVVMPAAPSLGTADDRRDSAPALRVLLLDEGTFLPERAVALPVLPGAAAAAATLARSVTH